MNDNKDDNNVISLKTKDKKAEVIANVFIKKGLIGLEVKEGVIFLTNSAAIDLCFILLSAVKVKSEIPTKRT